MGIAVRNVTLPHRYTGTHMPHGITQCYLPPDRDDIPAFTPAEAGTRLSDPGGMQGWVDLVDLVMRSAYSFYHIQRSLFYAWLTNFVTWTVFYLRSSWELDKAYIRGWIVHRIWSMKTMLSKVFIDILILLIHRMKWRHRVYMVTIRSPFGGYNKT